MKYLIIGLGNLGRALARDLTSAGNEVIGVDRDEQVVEEMKQSVSSVVALDSTDINSLNSLPLSDMDAIIVTFEKLTINVRENATDEEIADMLDEYAKYGIAWQSWKHADDWRN